MIVELFMIVISLGVIISIFLSKDFLWSDKLIFLIAELYLLIGVCVNLIKIRKKGRN
ncbi:UNVERIFIED_CONTAM: putative ferric reductase [Paenibacillus sp. PvR008]